MEPAQQRQVIGQAAKAGHGRVSVGVDQAGKDEKAGEVHFAPSMKPLPHLIRWADGKQVRPVDGNSSRTEAWHPLVAGHQPRDVGQQ